jgi:type IV pilus assembly protein PilM
MVKSNAFGLDIGTTNMKVVWVGRDDKHIVYQSSLSAFAPERGMQSESPFDHQEMAVLINKLVIDAKIETNNVNISLPDNHVYTRVIDMPLLSNEELSNAIYWEAEQYVPAPLDTVTLAWSKLREYRSPLGENKMQVLLVVAPKELIKKYQNILDLAGLTIVSIETELLALIRGVIADNSSPTALLMNIGAMNSSLCIIQNGILVFNYSFPLGGVALTRAIASDFGFSLAQAEEYKIAYGLSDKQFEGKVKKAIDPILGSMLSEVRKAMTVYNERYKSESAISQMLLTGGTARLPGLASYFAQNMGIETVIANPWKMLNIQNVPQEVMDKGPAYAVALGLALKEYEQ